MPIFLPQYDCPQRREPCQLSQTYVKKCLLISKQPRQYIDFGNVIELGHFNELHLQLTR
jgi:hypothetical protein